MTIDAAKLFPRLYSLIDRGIDRDGIVGSYELTPVSMSLFETNKQLRKGNKALLRKAIVDDNSGIQDPFVSTHMVERFNTPGVFRENQAEGPLPRSRTLSGY